MSFLNYVLGVKWTQKVNEYDQTIPQSHTSDQPMTPRGKVKER